MFGCRTLCRSQFGPIFRSRRNIAGRYRCQLGNQRHLSFWRECYVSISFALWRFVFVTFVLLGKFFEISLVIIRYVECTYILTVSILHRGVDLEQVTYPFCINIRSDHTDLSVFFEIGLSLRVILYFQHDSEERRMSRNSAIKYWKDRLNGFKRNGKFAISLDVEKFGVTIFVIPKAQKYWNRIKNVLNTYIVKCIIYSYRIKSIY